MFIFDGGILSKSDIQKIKLPEEELSEFKFVSVEEAEELLGEKVGKRIAPGINARNNNSGL